MVNYPFTEAPERIHPDDPMCAHPLADMFPMASRPDAEVMRDSLTANGFNENHPIVLIDTPPEWVEQCGPKLVLEGRNRFYNSIEVGAKPTFRDYHAEKDGPSPLEYVIRQNLARRQLSESDRAVCAAHLMPLLKAEREARGNINQGGAPVKPLVGNAANGSMEFTDAPRSSSIAPPKFNARKEAAAVAGASERLTGDAARIHREDPVLWGKVKTCDLTVSEAVGILKERARQAAKAEAAKEVEPLRAKAIENLRNTHGDEVAEAVRLRNIFANTDDLLFFSTLPPATARLILPLCMNGMSSRKAVAIKEHALLPTATISELITRAHLNAGAEGIFTDEVGAYRLTITIPAALRSQLEIYAAPPLTRNQRAPKNAEPEP